MAKTGILTEEQFALVSNPLSRFEVLDSIGGVYKYSKVYEDDLQVVYLTHKEDKFSYFVVTKENREWEYFEADINSVSLDNNFLTLTSDGKVTVNVANVKSNLESTFITSSGMNSKLSSKVPNTRKVNDKALTSDITVAITDNAVQKTWTFANSSKKLDADIDVDYSYLTLPSNRYRHQITAYSGYTHICFHFFNNVSTAYSNATDVLKAINTLGFKSTSVFLPASGSNQNGADCDIDGVYSDGSTLYYSQGRDYSWNHSANSLTIHDKVTTLY